MLDILLGYKSAKMCQFFEFIMIVYISSGIDWIKIKSPNIDYWVILLFNP